MSSSDFQADDMTVDWSIRSFTPYYICSCKIFPSINEYLCVYVCVYVPVEYFREDAGRVVAVGGGGQWVALWALRAALARQTFHPGQWVRETLQHLLGEHNKVVQMKVVH